MIWRAFAVAAIGAATVAAAQQPFELDTTFRLDVQSINVASVAVLSSGDILLSGRIDFPGDTYSRRLARYHPDGTRDLTFVSPHGGVRITPWNDKYYTYDGTVYRLLADGTPDTSFINMNTGPYFDFIQGGDYHVYPDGRILMSGDYYLEDSTRGFVGLYSLIWFSNQGYLDTTKTHRQSAGPILRIKEMPNGKFMCSGGGGQVQGRPVSTIFRVQPDGVLDTTFNAPFLQLGFSYWYQPLAEGKVMACGYFRFLNSLDTMSLVRFLPDGTIDPTFHSPYCEVTYDISSVAIVGKILPMGPDKYIITGNFNQVNGQSRGGIAMIDTAGNLLDSYFTSGGCGGYWEQTPVGDNYHRIISGVYPAPDGSYYLYGSYHGYDDGTTNDTLQRLVSRLYGLNVGINEHAPGQVQPLQITPNPSSSATTLSTSAPVHKGTLTIHDASGRIALQGTWPAGSDKYILPTGALAPGTYVVRVAAGAAARNPAGGYVGRLVVMP